MSVILAVGTKKTGLVITNPEVICLSSLKRILFDTLCKWGD